MLKDIRELVEIFLLCDKEKRKLITRLAQSLLLQQGEPFAELYQDENKE